MPVDAASTEPMVGGDASSRLDAGTGARPDAAGSPADAATDVGDAAEEDGSTNPPPATPFPSTGSDLGAPGTFETTTLSGAGPGGNYTVYHPVELAPEGAANPVVVWMNGGGTSNGLYTLLPHLASHGFVVIASNTVPAIGAEVALGEELLAAITWALAENERADSTFFEKLDSGSVAAAGYSMGSLATFTMADDPRLATTLHISGGNMAPERVENLRQPAAFICGTPGTELCTLVSGDCDIAAVNCDTDFELAQTPVFYANFEGGHLGILTPPVSDRINEMSTAWLRFMLMGDSSLEPRFVGPSCDYCNDPLWKVQQKQLP